MENDQTPAPPNPSETQNMQEFQALQAVIGALNPFGDETRKRILDAAARFLRVEMGFASAVSYAQRQGASSPSHVLANPPFSADTAMSPKEFMLEKQPRTDLERVACLAYYLTHYRDVPHFKTLDLSKLNTEAAQPKFANATYSTNNAVKRGYLVPSTQGQRQLSAAGERFVQALPDRHAAKAVMVSVRPRRQGKRGKSLDNAQD
jgi:hypothetical protein